MSLKRALEVEHVNGLAGVERVGAGAAADQKIGLGKAQVLDSHPIPLRWISIRLSASTSISLSPLELFCAAMA